MQTNYEKNNKKPNEFNNSKGTSDNQSSEKTYKSDGIFNRVRPESRELLHQMEDRLANGRFR